MCVGEGWGMDIVNVLLSKFRFLHANACGFTPEKLTMTMQSFMS